LCRRARPQSSSPPAVEGTTWHCRASLVAFAPLLFSMGPFDWGLVLGVAVKGFVAPKRPRLQANHLARNCSATDTAALSQPGGGANETIGDVNK
jgi:hypothetical protein